MALESVRLPATILQNGGRLGPYEITSQIGAGGMGEVYRATDTNLKRSVAIKVLQSSVASDADRLARFQREAEILATLNHPNIGAIYGVERADGIVALVMELVDGPTLAERIAQGAMPLDEALPIASQIANALEAAHDQGIIHRDLKPANVKLRPDGVVKVLDFGLAKFAGTAAPESFGPTDLTRAAVSASPTIVSPVRTQVGMILGTAAYMSPEQARGRTADKRSDVWAFGCVLYEMLTGRRAFEGDEVSDVLAGVLKSDPRWDTVPAVARHLLQTCVQKDPRNRLRDIGDMRHLLEAATTSAPEVSPATVRQSQWRLGWIAAGIVTAAFLGLAAVHFREAEPSVAPVRFEITPRGGDIIRIVNVSPNGRQITYITQGPNGQFTLWVRSLDSAESARFET